jgi:hypothetical protein
MIMLNTLAAYHKPPAGERSWKTSRNHWGYTLNFIKRTHQTRLTPLFKYWFEHNGHNMPQEQRAVKAFLFHYWHDVLDNSARSAWKSAASGLTLTNYKNGAVSVSGYALFIHHNYLLQNIDTITHALPLPQNLVIVQNPPTPYALPPKPTSATVLAVSSSILSLRVNWVSTAYAGESITETRVAKAVGKSRQSTWFRAAHTDWFYSATGPYQTVQVNVAYPFRQWLGPLTCSFRIRRPRSSDRVMSDPYEITVPIP